MLRMRGSYFEPNLSTSKQWITKHNDTIFSQIIFFKNLKFMLKLIYINDKFDSKVKSVLFLFLFHLKKIHHFGGPNQSPNPNLPGLGRKKNSSSTSCHIAVLLNLKFQHYKFKNNEGKAIIFFLQFC
jgi:hypothetical protein